ncbi:uncharacterized protein DUF326 [Salsuginibacillus halophilus]|uniref:Uncharacterized protein DUF326 n=1 Tax=Salsuginibacillus halophilus TaxID=517424 RepID=A0A2P8HHX3_9BACI|nr:four-helix bundle copper-binding protein [Salsuginibacillus halophilus]PSL45813.1 uncharacterized protein DUF326 [Salsuginibacillus halophilus]
MEKEQQNQLLEALQACQAACNQCFDACLEEDHVGHMTTCLRLDRECADMCAYLAQAVQRGSPFVTELAAVCAKICETCADECAKHDDEHCQQCAKMCRECAQVCREVAA